jgi:hypothetical protein
MAEVIYHKKHKSLKPRRPAPLPEPTALESYNLRIPEILALRKRLLREATRSPLRKTTDDFTSQTKLHWGLPNNLLGYNLTVQQRFDMKVQEQRRNRKLMESFQIMNQSVANLQALLSAETDSGIKQIPDRNLTGGKPVTMQNFIENKLAHVKN